MRKITDGFDSIASLAVIAIATDYLSYSLTPIYSITHEYAGILPHVRDTKNRKVCAHPTNSS